MQIKIDDKVIMEVSQTDTKCLKDSILDPKEWFISALMGKINNCKKRMFLNWIPKLRARSLSIPADDNNLIDMITSQADYKDRAAREEEAKKKQK